MRTRPPSDTGNKGQHSKLAELQHVSRNLQTNLTCLKRAHQLSKNTAKVLTHPIGRHTLRHTLPLLQTPTELHSDLMPEPLEAPLLRVMRRVSYCTLVRGEGALAERSH